MSTYKSNLFALCKVLERSDLANKIKNMRSNLNNSDGQLAKSIWLSMTNDRQNHFYGVLLGISESNEKNNNGIISKMPLLSEEELKICKYGNEFLLKVCNLLINELDFLPTPIKESLNPYTKLRKIGNDFYENIPMENIENIDLSKLSQSFKKLHLVNSLREQQKQISSDILNKIQLNNMLEIFTIFSRDESQYGYEEVPPSLLNISKHKIHGSLSFEEQLEYFFFSLYVLRDIIQITLNTLYSVLGGGRLALLTNDNIISIKGPSQNHLYKRYEFSKIPSDDKGEPEIANLCLVNFQRSSSADSIVNCLAFTVSLSHSFAGNFGDTTTLKVLEVDNDLNRYYNFFK
ncbi:hypothetical protein ACVRW7_06960 [Streptococcus ratti]|uniref:Uncharacterized protein n=1 Tax=Streptococcus ratti FA-1 = DSM 20564 TaxID=699248 RepID=A0ABP2QYD9_STRRT|nr:hypothetical protein [Streptococcus ratti]EJN94075.1 hypothetical protein SRA_06046 [Streptococcus ratti FA-1 = DSM 20564]EMP70582.1 hypothetical protein D822_03834 [Streptococcus ratti FA-1 = DSM 20564]QEY07905.1 hypothetical protein FY406_09720 [Streptococcus ratti]VEI60375.1 Uncharacterised protein [Streptococcus mutans]